MILAERESTCTPTRQDEEGEKEEEEEKMEGEEEGEKKGWVDGCREVGRRGDERG